MQYPKKILMLALIIISGLLLIWHFTSNHPKKPVENHVVTVKISPLRYYTIPKTIIAYGTTVSPKSVGVTAQTSGIIASIEFQAGTKVAIGQTLFTLRTSDIGNQIEKLKAQMQSSKTIYDSYAKIEKELPGSVAKNKFIQAKQQYQQDLATYKEAKTIGIIKAPIAGVVSDTDVTLGSYVTQGQTLTTVVVPSSLLVEYQIPGHFSNDVKLGQAIQFHPNDASQSYQGIVSYIAPSLNKSDYSLTLRANLDNAESLKYSSFGKVEQVIDPNYKILAIPQSLAQTDSQGFFIYTVSKNKVVQQYFTPGQITKDGLIQIKSGLTENTPIISSDPSHLSAGETVQVENK